MSKQTKKRDEDMLAKLTDQEVVNLKDAMVINAPENTTIVEELDSSLIVRILNPYSIKPSGIASALPKIWDVEEHVRACPIGQNRLQFYFDRADDMKKVLSKAPCYVNGWMVTGERWINNPSPSFLNRILFWGHIKNIPINFITEETLRKVGSAIGEVTEELVLHAKTPNSMEYVRARIWILVDNPIVFKFPISFNAEEPIVIEFVYEKLQKFFLRRKHLTHDQYHCPLPPTSGSLEVTSKRLDDGIPIKSSCNSSKAIHGQGRKQLKDSQKELQADSSQHQSLPNQTQVPHSRSVKAKGKEVALTQAKQKAKPVAPTAWRLKPVKPSFKEFDQYKIQASRNHPFVAKFNEALETEGSLRGNKLSSGKEPPQSSQYQALQSINPGTVLQSKVPTHLSERTPEVSPPRAIDAIAELEEDENTQKLRQTHSEDARLPASQRLRETEVTSFSAGQPHNSAGISGSRMIASIVVDVNRTPALQRLEKPFLQPSERLLNSGKRVQEHDTFPMVINSSGKKRKTSAERNIAKKKSKFSHDSSDSQGPASIA